MKKTAIIVAGGKGLRMESVLPKQFIEIHAKPILLYTLECFHNFDKNISLILVLPENQIEYWKKICEKQKNVPSHQIVVGGENRFQSVKNGLQKVEFPSVVAVHDGVRPLVSEKTLSACFDLAEKFPAVVPVVELEESIRIVKNENKTSSCDRSLYRIVQTPQVFDGEILLKAYQQDFSPIFTDDASVVESLGVEIQLANGNNENIKITTQFHLKIAATLLENKEV